MGQDKRANSFLSPSTFVPRSSSPLSNLEVDCLCCQTSIFFQVTAVFPVGNGQCIALGYESVLPLVLLTLQGGDMKPYEFPTEGSKAMAGTGMIHSYF